jgi:hypothetical protein
LPPQELSEKERALLEAARHEAASKASAATRPVPNERAPGSTPTADGAAPRVPADRGVPLDHPMVVGSDHPAARASAEAARKATDRERWTLVGELLKAERMAAEARRERLRRNGLGVLAALLLLVLVAVMTTLVPGLTS